MIKVMFYKLKKTILLMRRTSMLSKLTILSHTKDKALGIID